jgi:hypothetical protein
MDALWPSLCTDDKRALRLCSTAMRDAVDAHASSLEGPAESPVLSRATCARLSGVRMLKLSSMECLRGMLVTPPQPGAFFPRLQSLRLPLADHHQHGVSGCAAHGWPMQGLLYGARMACMGVACMGSL